MTRQHLIFITGLALTIPACTSQSLETTFNEQETDIADYAETAKFVACEFIRQTDADGNPQFNDDGSEVLVREATDTIIPAVTHNGGATRLTIIDGSGAPLSESGSATIYFAGYVFTSGPEWTDYVSADIDGTGTTWLLSTPLR